jgi:NAD(P)-dependent dehydrogenase (short-subunit alcohol dehydrogenase family)
VKGLGDLAGRTVVLTGGGAGIGLETADALAAHGARLVLLELDPDRGRAAAERVGRHGIPPRVLRVDLSSMAEVRRVAAEILATEPRIDVLVNSAGAWFDEFALTPEGLERTFALNHMAYFLLTNLLLERIVESAPARIVCVSSDGHVHETLDFDDLQNERDYAGDFPGFRSYCRSKLANVLFTRALARRLEGTGVTVNCCFPGYIMSSFHDTAVHATAGARDADGGIPGLSPVADGAWTPAWLAGAPELEGVTGGYFEDRAIVEPSEAARNDEDGERLWRASAELAGLPPEVATPEEQSRR